MAYITLTKENINSEHICCAFSDKKCAKSYELKKQWLTREFDNGYVFRRLDERAKVFIEYGPSEKAWVPVTAPNYTVIGCFWVSGKYKRNGHGKSLLQEAIEVAKNQGKDGLVAVVGTKKFHFMSDTKWFLGQSFEICESILLVSVSSQWNSMKLAIVLASTIVSRRVNAMRRQDVLSTFLIGVPTLSTMSKNRWLNHVKSEIYH